MIYLFIEKIKFFLSLHLKFELQSISNFVCFLEDLPILMIFIFDNTCDFVLESIFLSVNNPLSTSQIAETTCNALLCTPSARYAHLENNFVLNTALQPSFSSKTPGALGAQAPPLHLVPSVSPSGSYFSCNRKVG